MRRFSADRCVSCISRFCSLAFGLSDVIDVACDVLLMFVLDASLVVTALEINNNFLVFLVCFHFCFQFQFDIFLISICDG